MVARLFSLLNFVYEILPDGLHHCERRQRRDLPRVQRRPVQLWHTLAPQTTSKASESVIWKLQKTLSSALSDTYVVASRSPRTIWKCMF